MNYLSKSMPLVYLADDLQDQQVLDAHREYVTSEDGYCTIDSLTQDKYALVVSRDGFFSDRTTDLRVNVPADAGKEFQLLVHRAGRLSGRVANIPKVETAGPGFWLVLQEASTRDEAFEHLFPISPSDGSFSSDDLRPETYKLFFEKQASGDKEYRKVSRRIGLSDAENRGRKSLGSVEIEPGKQVEIELRVP